MGGSISPIYVRGWRRPRLFHVGNSPACVRLAVLRTGHSQVAAAREADNYAGPVGGAQAEVLRYIHPVHEAPSQVQLQVQEWDSQDYAV
jgi:hypothetical protein